MNKTEFLYQLKELIQEELPQNKINETISFYDEYITDKTSIKSEEEIVNELGSPRLLAKTLIETYKISNDKYNGRQAYTETVEEDGTEDLGYNSQSGNIKRGKWYSKLLMIAIVVAVLFIIVIIGTFAIRLFFTFGVPIILCILLVKGISSVIKK